MNRLRSFKRRRLGEKARKAEQRRQAAINKQIQKQQEIERKQKEEEERQRREKEKDDKIKEQRREIVKLKQSPMRRQHQSPNLLTPSGSVNGSNDNSVSELLSEDSDIKYDKQHNKLLDKLVKILKLKDIGLIELLLNVVEVENKDLLNVIDLLIKNGEFAQRVIELAGDVSKQLSKASSIAPSAQISMVVSGVDGDLQALGSGVVSQQQKEMATAVKEGEIELKQDGDNDNDSLVICVYFVFIFNLCLFCVCFFLFIFFRWK